MTALINTPVRIIDSDGKESGIIRELDDLKMNHAVVINLRRLNNYKYFNDRFKQFKDLLENAELFKILYSEIEDDVRNLPASIGWQSRKDVVYVGEKLEFNEGVIRSYWNWWSNLKPVIYSASFFNERI